MEPYIRHIRINKVRHLQNIDIPVKDTTNPIEGRPVHVMLAGRNGAGKTSVLNAILRSVSFRIANPMLNEKQIRSSIEHWQDALQRAKDGEETARCEENLLHWNNRLGELCGAISLDFESPREVVSNIKNGEALLAYYSPNRKPDFNQPKVPAVQEVGPTKNVTATRSKIFLDFLLNLKVQRSLARDEGKDAVAASIDAWFQSFTDVLRAIYADETLRLEFNTSNYHFSIISKGKESPMDHLPDGYAALLDIIADLILKMQTPDSLVGAFEMPGIVLIDEVETHLHLELQKRVMPMLTQFFPKIQFIVTTHSPFVVSSIPNAVVVDLETGECMDDLDEYPYNSLAEGFFGVSLQSSYIQRQFEKLKELAVLDGKTAAQQEEIRSLLQDFQLSSKLLNPNLRAAVERLKFKYHLG